MLLVSTSKKTLLSDFADLETKSTYVHANGESTDFQFSAGRRVFVEVDGKAGLAVMRIKEKQENSPELQRVRKLTIDNVCCVGCAKQTNEEIAVGQATGYLKLYNFRSGQLLHRFAAEQPRSSLLHVDYNCTDEYISTVRENGEINIYGTKTKTKIETLNFDDNITLARFHPSKRFHLATASYKGAVALYDMQSKRKLFNLNSAHDAPCRDVSMCSKQPALLVSVGYDCGINVFDMRRKPQATASHRSYSHPLSTVGLSDCGTYFCVGSLKGELIAYDMRTLKVPLAVRAVHEGVVSRVAFVPISTEEHRISSLNSCSNTSAEVDKTAKAERVPSDNLRKSISTSLLSTQQQLETMSSMGYGTGTSVQATPATVRPPRDSFCDFLDAQGHRQIDRMPPRMTLRRDSFDWESLNRKYSNEEQRQSLCQIGSGLSSIDSANNSVVDSYDTKLQQTLSGPLRDRSNISSDGKLKQIAETDEYLEQQDKTANCSGASSNAGSDKENPPAADVNVKRRLRMLSASRNSTPHHGTGPAKTEEPIMPKTSSTLSSLECNADLRKEFDELRKFVDERISRMEQEMKWVSERNKWQIFTQAATYWNNQQDTTREIHDALALLLRTDRFMHKYSALQFENKILKEELQKLHNEMEDMQQKQSVSKVSKE